MSLGSALASTIASSKLSSSDSVRLRFAMTHMFRFFFAAASAAVPPSICLSSSSLASSNLASFWPRSAAERPRTFGSGSSPPHRPVKRQQIDRSRFMRSSSNGETLDASRQRVTRQATSGTHWVPGEWRRQPERVSLPRFYCGRNGRLIHPIARPNPAIAQRKSDPNSTRIIILGRVVACRASLVVTSTFLGI
jgi:hypothetical protein